MKANELRIGNYLQDQNGNILLVIHISTESIQTTVLDRSKYPLPNGWQMEPIPLTPEILEKCGFWYKPGGISGADMWQGMGFWYRVKELPNQEFLLRGDFSRKKPIALKLVGWFNSNIEYIHQLQNLYFSLTGEELEVKL